MMLKTNVSVIMLDSQQELEDQLNELKRGQALLCLMDNIGSGDLQVFMRDTQDQVVSRDLTEEDTIGVLLEELDNLENGW